MRHHELLLVSLAEVLDDERGVDLVGGVEGVEYVVVEHEVLIVLEAGDVLLLPDAIDDLLVFREEIIQDDLLAQDVDDLIIVDALCTVYLAVLVEAESLLEG